MADLIITGVVAGIVVTILSGLFIYLFLRKPTLHIASVSLRGNVQGRGRNELGQKIITTTYTLTLFIHNDSDHTAFHLSAVIPNERPIKRVHLDRNEGGWKLTFVRAIDVVDLKNRNATQWAHLLKPNCPAEYQDTYIRVEYIDNLKRSYKKILHIHPTHRNFK